jgi:hypothetical protein
LVLAFVWFKLCDELNGTSNRQSTSVQLVGVQFVAAPHSANGTSGMPISQSGSVVSLCTAMSSAVRSNDTDPADGPTRT